MKGCLVFIFCLAACSVLYAGPKGVSVLSGYGRDGAIIERVEEYQIIPFSVNIAYDADKTLKRGLFKKCPGYFEFQIEPFLSAVISPDNNVEFGMSLMLAWYYNLRFARPFIRLGAGPGYTTQHLREQATQWNFFDTAGIGIELPLSAGTALVCEYRYRHFSNASIKKPNKGVDTDIILLGYRKDF